MTRQHEMKCWPEYFAAIKDGSKTFELRRDDRGGFGIGDQLLLREWDPIARGYTGDELFVSVTYVMNGVPHVNGIGYGIRVGWSVLGFELIGETFSPGDDEPDDFNDLAELDDPRGDGS